MKDFFGEFRYSPDDAKPLADQVYSFVKGEMASGRLKAGDTLPAIKDIAAATGLTFRTARGVVERLAREKYVRSRPRVGTVVMPRDTRIVRGRVLFALPDVDASSYHATQIADALRRKMADNGFALTTVVFPSDMRRSLSFLRNELSNSPDLAVVLYALPHVRDCLRDAGVKCVFVYGSDLCEADGIWIRFSPDEAISSFAEHCSRTGVSSVMQVRFDGNETPDAEPALSAVGIRSAWTVVPRLDVLGRYEGIKRSTYDTFMEMPLERFPDVFLFWDDFVAQGALLSFMKRGIVVPDDVKVVTLSNRGLGPVYPVPLTRIECDAAAAGEKVADFVLSVLEKGRIPKVPVIAPQYVFGQTFPF